MASFYQVMGEFASKYSKMSICFTTKKYEECFILISKKKENMLIWIVLFFF